MGSDWNGAWTGLARLRALENGSEPSPVIESESYNRPSALVKCAVGYSGVMPRPGDQRAVEIREILARNLGAIRRYREMTQSVLAAEAGMTVDTLRGYEQGKRAPDSAILGVLAEVLRVAPGDFFLEEPPHAWRGFVCPLDNDEADGETKKPPQ